jgi:hypothetical protein
MAQRPVRSKTALAHKPGLSQNQPHKFDRSQIRKMDIMLSVSRAQSGWPLQHVSH